MKPMLPLLATCAVALASCQVPGSVSRAPSSPAGDGNDALFERTLAVGFPAPTWEESQPEGQPESTIPGWDIPVDHTYTRVRTDEKVIAITFDDGPHGKNTPRLLDMLKKRKIKATFYVVGNMVKYNPQLLRRMIAEGHEIGNHTVKHDNLARYSDEGLIDELQAAHDMIVEATGVHPKTMRPPGGSIKTDQKELMLEKLGYPTILWSVDPEDWKKPGVSVVTRRLVEGASPGGILLAHDLHKPTVDAMPSTLDQLLAKGYRFVTVSELIRMEDREPETEGAE